MNDAQRTKETIMLAKERKKFVDDITYNDTIEALDKQMPKKPIENPLCGLYVMYKCANCKDVIPVNTNYCPNCGQKIDWSE